MFWKVLLAIFAITLGISTGKNVKCDDHKTICPEDTTCCALGDGYGCCPMPNAICCEDKQHCCPTGMQCDTAHSKCKFGYLERPFFKPLPPLSSGRHCDNPSFDCPQGTTCCVAEGTTPGCCPAENAVCCEDGQHCCPHGYKCDVEARRCLSLNERLPWFFSFEAMKKSGRVTNVNVDEHKCEDNGDCSNQQTCCLNNNSGEDFCCPFKNGVCCHNLDKCCPEGFTCSTDSDECVKEGRGVVATMTMANGIFF